MCVRISTYAYVTVRVRGCVHVWPVRVCEYPSASVCVRVPPCVWVCVRVSMGEGPVPGDTRLGRVLSSGRVCRLGLGLDYPYPRVSGV